MKFLCWTRVGTAAGESIENIIARKEYERQASNDNIFFWQVGNAPLSNLQGLWKEKSRIQVIFSKQKTGPSRKESNPEKVLVWQNYKNCYNRTTHSIPEESLVTSGGSKCHSYALVCRTRTPLHDQWNRSRKQCFDPRVLDKEIARQRVTELFKVDGISRDKPDWMYGYCEEMEASLVRKYGYWVRLENPKEYTGEEWEEWKKILEDLTGLNRYQPQKWLELVCEIRGD